MLPLAPVSFPRVVSPEQPPRRSWVSRRAPTLSSRVASDSSLIGWVSQERSGVPSFGFRDEERSFAEPSDLVWDRLPSQLREARAHPAPRPIGQRTFRRAATLTPVSSSSSEEVPDDDFEDDSEDLSEEREL